MLKNEHRKIAKRKVQQLLEARFLRNLEQVQDYEKGPTYRLTLWYPMVVQLAKATLVRGAPFTIALGMIYLLSFLLIEGCLFAARKPLEEDDRAKALELLRSWGKLEAVPQIKYPGKRRRGVLLASASADSWQMFNTVIATIANASLCFWILRFNPFVALAQGAWKILQLFKIIGDLFKGPWFSWPLAFVATPFVFVMIALSQSFAMFSYLLGLVFAAGLPFWISMAATSLVQNYQERFSEVADMQEYRFGPAGAAIATGLRKKYVSSCSTPTFYSLVRSMRPDPGSPGSLSLREILANSVLVIFVAYFGLFSATGGLSYDCSTTVQIPFYNLLG